MSNRYFAHQTAVIDEGCNIGDNTKVWHFSHIMAGAKLGRDCNIGQNVMIANGVVVGDRVKIQNNVSVYEGVIISEDAFIGPSVVFTNIKAPRSFINRKHLYQNTMIGKGATLGANTTIICGNDIGAFAMIGAGAVVTKKIDDYALVIGNPARQIGWVSQHGARLTFDEGGIAVCPESGDLYKLMEGKALKLR